MTDAYYKWLEDIDTEMTGDHTEDLKMAFYAGMEYAAKGIVTNLPPTEFGSTERDFAQHIRRLIPS